MDNHPLLPPEIVHEVFSHVPLNESRTATRMTEVCRLWYSVGREHVWREFDGQLRGLVLNVTDQARRYYFASLFRTIYIPPGDYILGNTNNRLQSLRFPRLESIHMHLSNLVGIRSENIEALIVPSLRSFRLEHCPEDYRGDIEEDSEVLLNAMINGCASLRTLSLDFGYKIPEEAETLLLNLLDGITAIEHLDIGQPGDNMFRDYPAEDLLQRLLANKQNLVSICFPGNGRFSDQEVDTFLGRMGPDWSIPSLRSITPGHDYIGPRGHTETRAPNFESSEAAARMLDRMPNLEHLHLVLWKGRPGQWGDSLKHVFASISRLEHLKVLDLKIDAPTAEVRGEWLIQLGKLPSLERLILDVSVSPGVVDMTGIHLACLLADAPNLHDLYLDFGKEIVLPCSPEVTDTIVEAISRIPQWDTPRIKFIDFHEILD
jgi:hypothetical protein